MSLLRKKKYSGTGSSGSHIASLKDKIHGYYDFKVNRKKEMYNNDYVYLYSKELDDDGDYSYDGEVGINKGKYKVHDTAWCDEFKDEAFVKDSDVEEMANASLSDVLTDFLGEDDEELAELMDMIEEMDEE